MSKPKKCKYFDTCGNYKPPISRVSGCCDQCSMKVIRSQESLKEKKPLKRTPIKKKFYKLKRSPVKPTIKSLLKRSESINTFDKYVKRKIDKELKEKKMVCCMECGKLITREYMPKTFGFNVAHLISKGSDPSLYYLQENSIFLCREHHNQLDHGKPSDMRIHAWVEEKKNWVREHKLDLLKLPHNIYLKNIKK